ncbi:hypothetical protein Tco_0736477, partial [Tanacetum coccineum]
KDKDEDPYTKSDRWLKKRKTGKDAAPATGPKAKESQSGSSKGDKSQSKSFGKSAQSEEPEFEVGDSDMPQDQEENLGNDNEEPKEKVASKHDWFTKPLQPQEPTDPDWNVDKTPLQGQNQSWLMTLASSADKSSKTFDELMNTIIDFFLEYDFEECYKSLSEKIDWENPEGGDYPFNLTKPLPLVMSRNRQKFLLITSSTMISSICKEECDFPRLCIDDIEDMLLLVVHNRLTNLSGDDVSDFAIALRMFTRSLVIQNRVKDLQLGVESYQKKINVTRPQTTISGIRKRDPYTPYRDPQGFIYVDNNERNRMMQSDELYKFSDRTLNGL